MATLLRSLLATAFICPALLWAQGALFVKSLNNVLYADQFAGSDVGAKFNACIAALPETGGTCDGRGFQGAHTISTTINATDKPVKVLLGAATFTVIAAVGFDLGMAGSLEGLSPGSSPNAMPETASTTLRAGSTNTILVRDNLNGGGLVIRNLRFDGNHLTGSVALELLGADQTRLENLVVKNCQGEAVQLGQPVEVLWTGGLVEDNLGVGIHIFDLGRGHGSGNLQFRGISVRLNGGDGIIFEGGGSGQVFSGINVDRNRGAGIRIRMQSSSDLAPNGFTLDTITFEANGDPDGQLVMEGSAAVINSVTGNQLIFNGANEGFAPSPTGIFMDNVSNATFIEPYFFNGADALFLSNDSNILFLGIRNADTNLYKTGSAGASVLAASTNGLMSISQGLQLSSTTFSALGTPDNGTIYYCSDCSVTTPSSCKNITNLPACVCRNGGTGALAKRLGGAWICN
jgi:hypothetical protein